MKIVDLLKNSINTICAKYINSYLSEKEDFLPGRCRRDANQKNFGKTKKKQISPGCPPVHLNKNGGKWPAGPHFLFLQ